MNSAKIFQQDVSTYINLETQFKQYFKALRCRSPVIDHWTKYLKDKNIETSIR
jgi:hypothetical protein